jgi:hypothetical protein
MVVIRSLIRVPGESESDEPVPVPGSNWPTYCFLINARWWEYTGFELIPMATAPVGEEMLDKFPVKQPLFVTGIYCDGESITCTLLEGSAIAVELALVRFDPFVSWPVVRFHDQESMDQCHPMPSDAVDLRQF